MIYYESLLLANPSITQDEVEFIEKSLNNLAQSSKSAIVSFEKWGKYRLAYPVKKNEYGVYILVRFESEKASSLPKEVARLCKIKLNNVVMRDMTTRLEKNDSLNYQKPPSLEDTPSTTGAANVKTFLRDNNMEGLMDSVDNAVQEDTVEVKSEKQSNDVDSDSVKEESND